MDKDTALIILALKDNYSNYELKNRFRTLAKISHPDNNGDSDLFNIIKESYDVLSSDQSQEGIKNAYNNKFTVSFDQVINKLSYTDIIFKDISIKTDIRINIYKYIFPFIKKPIICNNTIHTNDILNMHHTHFINISLVSYGLYYFNYNIEKYNYSFKLLLLPNKKSIIKQAELGLNYKKIFDLKFRIKYNKKGDNI